MLSKTVAVCVMVTGLPVSFTRASAFSTLPKVIHHLLTFFTQFFSHALSSDKVLLLQICKGTVNIKVEEVEPSEAKIQVTGGNGTDVLVEG